MASPAPPANQNNLTPAAYVTLIRDDTAAEWEFVPWLRAAGARVDHDADGNDRIFNSPEARTVLIRYRRMLYARLNLIAQNIANAGTILDEQGASHPYRRQFIVAHPDGTFETQTDPAPFLTRFQPASPAADARGYVQYPNVDLPTEYVNAAQTTKSYTLVTQMLERFDPTLVDTVNSPDTLIPNPAPKR